MVERTRHGEHPAAIALATGDPFGGARRPGVEATLTYQAADGIPLYVALTPQDATGAARALASSWRTLGIGRGDTVLICDYGTSPLILFASWCFAPYLKKGAADLLGAVPICNDGLPEFAGRALHVLHYLRPRVTIIDHAQMPVFLLRVADERADVAGWTDLVVVSRDEEGVAADDLAEWSRALGVPVRFLLRSGSALFFAAECEQGALHADPRFYSVEVITPGGNAKATGEGTLCISNRFLRATAVDHHVANIQAIIEPSRCRCGRPGKAIRCPA